MLSSIKVDNNLKSKDWGRYSVLKCINESLNNKYLVKVIDILGRENSKQGLQIELYDDGSVKKKSSITTAKPDSFKFGVI